MSNFLGNLKKQFSGTKRGCPECGADIGKNARLCPECGHATLIFEEGCQKCYSCGFSEC